MDCTIWHTVPSFVHCGKLMCWLCYNKHMKNVHGALYTFELREGVLIESNYLFCPPPEKDVAKRNVLSDLSDDQLLEIAERLKLKIAK